MRTYYTIFKNNLKTYIFILIPILLFGAHGVFGWDELTSDVANDIEIARNAK